LIRVLKIKFFCFSGLETTESQKFYSKLQISKYLNSLKCSLDTRQQVLFPLLQILCFMGCYRLFKFLNHLKDPDLTLLFLCTMTLGIYLSLRSLVFTMLLIWAKYIKPHL
jgi:hypothetical protein